MLHEIKEAVECHVVAVTERHGMRRRAMTDDEPRRAPPHASPLVLHLQLGSYRDQNLARGTETGPRKELGENAMGGNRCTCPSRPSKPPSRERAGA